MENPFEKIFDLPENSSEDTEKKALANITIEKRETALVKMPELFDEKDSEIEEQFQEIYDYSISAFESQAKNAQLVEPKYRARNHEIAVQYLNTALNAVKEKSNNKNSKDKLALEKIKASKGGNGKITNNNLIVGDRSSIMDLLNNISINELESIDKNNVDE